MRKRFAILLLHWLVVAAMPAFAQENAGAAPVSSAPEAGFFYLALNPGALPSFFNLGFANVLLPILLSNLEYGFAASGGYAFGANTAEGRFAIGTSSGVFLVTMLQAGWFYAFAEPFGSKRGLYAGAFLRFWDLHNLLTGVGVFHLSPSVVIGWWIDVTDRFFIDLRINQSVAVVSWSSQQHTRPAFAFMFSPLPAVSPIMPTFNTNVGFRL